MTDTARLAELGLALPGFNSGTLDFSPDGTALALAGGNGASQGVLHLFPVAGDGTVQWNAPLKSYREVGVVATLDWAPDSQSLAAITLPSTEVAGKSSSRLDLATRVFSRTGRDPRVVQTFQIPADPAYLDFIAQTKLLSWSH